MFWRVYTSISTYQCHIIKNIPVPSIHFTQILHLVQIKISVLSLAMQHWQSSSVQKWCPLLHGSQADQHWLMPSDPHSTALPSLRPITRSPYTLHHAQSESDSHRQIILLKSLLNPHNTLHQRRTAHLYLVVWFWQMVPSVAALNKADVQTRLPMRPKDPSSSQQTGQQNHHLPTLTWRALQSVCTRGDQCVVCLEGTCCAVHSMHTCCGGRF